MKLIIILLILSLMVLNGCVEETPTITVDMENIKNITCNKTQLFFDGKCINQAPFNITLE